MAAPLSAWPWKNLGSYKYLLHGPLLWKVLSSQLRYGAFHTDFFFHILLLYLLRIAVFQGWHVFSYILFVNDSKPVIKRGYDYKQIDHEWDWDNYLILQSLLASVVALTSFNLCESPFWNTKGFITAWGLHVTVSESLYYWFHRFLHQNSYFFKNYHSKQHCSSVLHPFTGVNTTLLEHIMLAFITSLPLFVTYALGFWSIGLVYAYLLSFDFLVCHTYCNAELLPKQLFQLFPFLKYIIQTPRYRTLHYVERSTNFSLLMPIYDIIWKTCNPKSWTLQKEAVPGDFPGFVFLGHLVSVMGVTHLPFIIRSFSSLPYKMTLYIIPFWPLNATIMLGVWVFSNTTTISCYRLKGHLMHTWGVPCFSLQYFLPLAKKGINERIENAILRADKLGVKVLCLAALNKNEALNGGGTLFVNKHPNLKVRIVHGNTLTAAVILNEIPKDCKEVFLTGATSKLGRAIALYLCRRGVRVLMMTHSAERFQKIQKEATPEFEHHLVHVKWYQAAETCKTWIIGKWIMPWEQKWAPKGTHFHQFVIPPILAFRRDCTYGKLAALKLPEDVEGLGSCEYTMGRGVVHACHAGGIVHLLEGYQHHEVGPIDIDQIDVVWTAALRHGFRPV